MLRIKKIFTAEIAKLLTTPQRKATAIKRKIAQASQRRKITKRRIIAENLAGKKLTTSSSFAATFPI